MDPYAPFRSRDFRFFITGTFLSNFGIQMLSVAVSWDLYIQTRSAVVLGNVGFVQVAPFLVFALAAGHVADRFDRRRVMLITQLIVIASAIMLITARPSVLIIYASLLLNAIARSFQGPARMAILPHVVPIDVLRRAITWHSSAQEIASVSGPALAGLLLSTRGSRTIYVFQLVCATLVFACVFMLSVRLKPGPPVPSPDRSELLEGVRFVWKDPLILPAISLDLFGVLFGGATALLPIYAVQILHAGARGLGWLRAAPSFGAVSMAILLSHSRKIHRPGRLLLLAVAGFGAATVVFGISRSLWLSFAMLLLTGAFDNISVVLRQSLVQMRTPDYLKGRVLAVQNIFISCSNQVGSGRIRVDRGVVRRGGERGRRWTDDHCDRQRVRVEIRAVAPVEAISDSMTEHPGGAANMRMMMPMTMPVEAGNEAASTGTLGTVVQKMIEQLKPEAAYFGAGASGERGGFFVFDMKDTSEIPAIAEPFFLAFNAKVTFFPVMNAQDLANAMPAIAKAVKEYGKTASA